MQKQNPNCKESCAQVPIFHWALVQKFENVHFNILSRQTFDIEVLKTLDKHVDKVTKGGNVIYTSRMEAKTVQGAPLACHGCLVYRSQKVRTCITDMVLDARFDEVPLSSEKNAQNCSK